MEEISVNGENYVKASSIARELGYTSDYVGQLCRGGQVVARLVGRSWYVKPDSLRGHKEGRYRSTGQKTRAEVKKTLGALRAMENKPNYLRRLNLLGSYENDSTPLLPSLQKGSSTSESASKIGLVRIKANQDSSPQDSLQTDDDDTVPIKHYIKASARKERGTVISARSNQIGRHSINIGDFSPKPSVSGGLALTGALIAATASVLLLFLNFNLESRVSVSQGVSVETYKVSFEFLKKAFSAF